VPGEGALPAIEDAPGSYAKLRLDAEPGADAAKPKRSAKKPAQ
jgi:hypothetical protein